MTLHKRLLWLFGLVLMSLRLPAVEQVSFQAERVEGEGWAVQALDLQAGVTDSAQLRLQLAAEALRLREPDMKFRDIQLQCPAFSLFSGGGSRCEAATFSFAAPPWKTARGELSWHQAPAELQLRVDELRTGKGVLKGSLSRQGRHWQFQLELLKLALQPLLAWQLPQWEGGGTLGAEASGSLEEQGPWQLALKLEPDRLQFSDAEGLHVGEKLKGRVTADLSGKASFLRGSLKVAVHRGQLYFDPFFVEFDPKTPFSAEVAIEGEPERGRWKLRRFAGRYPKVFRFSGTGSTQNGTLEKLALEYSADSLERTYGLLLQPLLIGTALDALTVRGGAKGELQVEKGGLQRFLLHLEKVDLEDGQAHRFGFEGLAGRVIWAREGGTELSSLGWREGHLYRVKLGSLDARFLASGDRLEMKPFSLELLSGRLRLRDLHLSGLLGGSLRWQASASLEGVRLEKVSQALDWPPMQGELNADIPKVHYLDGRLQLDGELVVEVFGGRVVIEGLSVEDPFGVAPVLETSIRLENLDLAQVSQTFSFGRIEGSLEGYVHNLRLVGWELAAFEAELRSPPKDRRRHRISQKAIDNLTELGNGMAAGLSGTFLGMFKDFAYDRLQLSIRLKGDTAELDGAPGPKGGYYIVKGARLPRVDVIGRNRRVAWKDLLSRLKQIRFEGVVVE